MKLTIDEQRKVVKEKFQKLRDNFLTKEQSDVVYLKELSEDYGLTNNPGSSGFIRRYGTMKGGH